MMAHSFLKKYATSVLVDDKHARYIYISAYILSTFDQKKEEYGEAQDPL
jgi:hypothetical protein